jgi:2-polyprenyl-3-methyl-5-hydroxy-6-metoxy-1,4-benzoquinol methylase
MERSHGIRSGWSKPLQTLRNIVAYQLQPPPLHDFTNYDDYWVQRGAPDPDYIFRRWEVAAAAMEDGSSVLGVGCGPGGFLQYLKRRRPHMRISGCDISAVAVEKARQQGLDVFIHDIEKSPLQETYDYITCFDVLEHIPHAEQAFRHFKGNFRKALFVSVPNIGCLRCRVRLGLFGKFPPTNCILHMNEHLRHWTVRDFRYWMKQEGMRILRIDGQYGLRGFYRWLPGLFAHGLVYTLGRGEDRSSP